MKPKMCLISKTKQIYPKILTVPESTFKIKAVLPWILFEILLTSAVICKQRFLHEAEIVQYLQNYKHQDINQGQFRKPLRASTNSIKQLSYMGPYIFHRLFNFKLLFTLKLLYLSNCFDKINQTTFF